MDRDDKWPFRDPENVAVFTSKTVVAGEQWIRYVTHDAEDGAWQFHPASGPTSESEAAVVSLRTIVKDDPSVCALADLPLGWCAWRDSKTSDWHRQPLDAPH